MNLKPLFDRVVIKPCKNQTQTNLGLVLPETSQERPQTGVVVAVGDGTDFEYQNCEMKVSIGDKVVFSKYAGIELKLDGEVFVVLRQIDIIGVVYDRENNC